MTQVFTVSGKTYVDDDLIFCRHLVFANPAESRLVILPKKGAPPGALRMLKIVANDINAVLAAGTAEITYNLDNDATLPLAENGLDPETPLTVAPLPLQPSKVGAKGNPDAWQGPFLPCKDPNKASPDFCVFPVDPAGSYPKATDGGDGKDGGRGGKGVNGLRAPIVEIWTNGIAGDIEIDLRGQSGGQGGQGGSGQWGGRGQDGAAAVPGTDTNWLGIPNLVCKEPAGLGGTGGRGGSAGCGGDGGDGGNGGVLKVFYTAGVNLALLHPSLTRGFGGNPGGPGSPGKGGAAGNPGLNLPPCPATTLSSQKGPDGDMCRQSDTGKGGISQKGQDGKDGQYFQWQVTALPHVASLWP